MKKRIFSLLLVLVSVVACSISLSACGNTSIITTPQRVHLSLKQKLHVEYENSNASLPACCILVKEDNCYYIKTPQPLYPDRTEVFEKVNLNNAINFAGEEYAQGYISAHWSDYSENHGWISAASETDLTPSNSRWHANDRNNHVYSVGISFLDYGYGDINHPYENGVADANGHKYTATQLSDAQITIHNYFGETNVNCVVWEYEEYHSENNWRKSKYWLDAETNIVLKQTTIYPSSDNQDLDADENIRLKATYFDKTNMWSMDSYLESINRNPTPDFSNFR